MPSDRADHTMGCDGVSDDQLLRYLMGDLEAAEAAEVEALVRDNPACQKRLAILQGCLDADAAAEADAETPPEDLVSRTAEIVMRSPASRVGECVGRKRFSLLDLAAMGVAALLLAAIALPALQSARESSRLTSCDNNLRTIGQALQTYRVNYESHYPAIGPYDNAGMFSVALAEAGVIDRETLQQALLCPASNLATQVAANRAAVVVPTRSQLQVAGPVLLDRLRQFMGGSYAYRIGYLDERGVYVWGIGPQECRSPLLADTPTRCSQGKPVTTNHGGCGQNVLFADGHVEFVASCWSPGAENHLFLNDDNQIAAGQGREDLVLAPSGATPGIDRVVGFRHP